MDVFHTKLNPHPSAVQRLLAQAVDAGRTPADAASELAGRVCYKSTDRMGTVEFFVRNTLWRKGHHDTLEHNGIVARGLTNTRDQTLMLLGITQGHAYEVSDGGIWFNMRTLNDHIDGIRASKILPPSRMAQLAHAAHEASPSIFESNTVRGRIDPWHRKGVPVANLSQGKDVYCLGWTYGPDGDPAHMSVMFDGVSRNFTHQLVRHRLGSYSQESQRYVDARKAAWDIMYPFGATDDQKDLIARVHEYSHRVYKQLRASGMKKEDARTVLTGGERTRIVVSGPAPMWEHFFLLRSHNSAQYEIRDISDAAKWMWQSLM